MINYIRCRNFKCFKDTGRVKIAPITVLVGENNSGKTALIQALYLPALTLKSEDPAVSLRLLTEDYDYGSFKDLVFNHEENKKITFEYGGTIEGLEDLVKKHGKFDAKLIVSYGYDKNVGEIKLRELSLEDERGERLRLKFGEGDTVERVYMRGYEKYANRLNEIYEQQYFFAQPRYDPFKTSKLIGEILGEERVQDCLNELVFNFRVLYRFAGFFERLTHLGPIRVTAKRTYLYSGEVTKNIGERGERALQNYAAMIRKEGSADRKVKSLIEKGLAKLGFVVGIYPERVGTRHYEFWTSHRKSNLRANLADTGFGASQVFPVILSLMRSKKGETLLFEQPEIHLHPAAQAELGSVFVRAFSSKKRFVVETHSESLMLRILTELVRRKKFNKEDIIVHYTLAGKGTHKVRTIPVNDKGEFLRNWPKGFFEENYRESLKLFQARQR